MVDGRREADRRRRCVAAVVALDRRGDGGGFAHNDGWGVPTFAATGSAAILLEAFGDVQAGGPFAVQASGRVPEPVEASVGQRVGAAESLLPLEGRRHADGHLGRHGPLRRRG